MDRKHENYNNMSAINNNEAPTVDILPDIATQNTMQVESAAQLRGFRDCVQRLVVVGDRAVKQPSPDSRPWPPARGAAPPAPRRCPGRMITSQKVDMSYL